MFAFFFITYTMLPLLFVYALHAIVKVITKRGDWWFLHGFDFLACPLASAVWGALEMSFNSKSLSNLGAELLLPCWAWCLSILARSIMNLFGMKIDKRKWSLWGCVALVAIVTAAYIFIPCLPE